MYRIVLKDVDKTHEYEELIKVFLRPGKYEILREGEGDLNFCRQEDKNLLKQEIYFALKKLTGTDPPWGIVTGIRPVKMTGDLMRKLQDSEKVRKVLENYYRISREKTDLVMDIYSYQQEIFDDSPEDRVGIYIGIPFCPSRCYYCSFTSNQAEKEEVRRYMNALYEEIDFVAKLIKAKRWGVESIYIGGGTPTVLEGSVLKEFLYRVRKRFLGKETEEFTLEAGRADTITEEKLSVAGDAGVNRISINPQTMNERTLGRIGRRHSAGQVVQAFEIARDVGFHAINADVIAGLPGEDREDFERTLDRVLQLEPENITVHSLAVKRGSDLAVEDEEYHYRQGRNVTQMLDVSRKVLKREGYRPYYLYRQKHMSGSQENIGYCREGTAGLYNVRIMDEHQTIIALGAGGVTKVYDSKKNQLSRVPNVNNYNIYVERLSQMLERKMEGLNGGKKKC